MRNFSEHLRATVSQRRLIPWCQKDVANLLFWAIWACLATAVKNDSINFWNNLMKTFIHMQNTNFIAHSFLEILHLKDSCNSWPLTWTICKIRCLRCNTWVLILEYIQENIMTNFCKKKKKRNAKSRIFGSSWAHFAQYWEKQTFPQISVVTTFVFLLILTKHYCVKFQKTNDWIPINTGFRQIDARSHGQISVNL